MSWSRPIGAALIVAGTAIGGGILALPIVSAQLGFFPMLILMLVTWFVMCISSLLTLRINLIISPGGSFLTMTGNSLGVVGKVLSTLSFLFLFYALLAAYISGASSFLESYLGHYAVLNWSHAGYCLLAAGIVICILILGVSTVDRINRLFFLVMVTCFILIVGFLLTPAKASRVFLHFNYTPGLALAVLPVVYTAFGFHGCTTPLVGYVGNRPIVLRWVFIIGSVLPLIAYILWLVASLGVLNTAQTQELAVNGTVGHLVRILSSASGHSKWFLPLLNLFSGFAIITSFLGVALGLFDYIYSAINKNDKLFIRIITGLLTFIPPLVFAVYYPNAFVAALGYAAIPLAFIATLLPVAMMWVLSRQGHVFKGQFFYWLSGVFSVLIIVAQLGVAWGWLPSLG